jgi:hypothetical protein
MRRYAAGRYCTPSRSCALKTTSTDMLCTISTHATPCPPPQGQMKRKTATVCDRGYNSETDADLMEEMKRVREESEAKDARVGKLESIMTGIACHSFSEC